VSEEVRFFARIAAYTAFIAAIYWFVSYERAGTVLLIFLCAAAAVFAAMVVSQVRAARGSERAKGRHNPVRRSLGFDDPDASATEPLQLEEDLYPTATLWPLGLALGLTLAAVGLVYGPWLWIPGLAISIGCGISWLTELDHSGP
jgi:hypothetical protein